MIPPADASLFSDRLDQLPAAVMTTTLAGEINWANQRLRSWSHVEIVPGHTTVHDLLSATSSLVLETSLIHRLSLEGHIDDAALELLGPENSTRHTLWNARTVDDEITWIGLDISARRYQEREAAATRRRLELLQRLSTALVGVDAPSEMARAMLDELVDGVKADWGAIVPPDDPKAVLAQRAIGTADLDVERRLGHVERALRDATPSFESGWTRHHGEPEQVAVIPLVAGADPLGAVCLRLGRAEPFDDVERQLFLAAAEMTSSALGRAALLERLELEAELNLRLSGLLHSLEAASTLPARAQLIAEALVPDHADLVTVSLAESAELVGLRHVDRSKEATIRWLHARMVSNGRLHGDEKVPDRSGQAVDMTDPAVTAEVMDANEVDAVQSLGIGAVTRLPLIARGRTIGLVSLGWADPRPPAPRTLDGFHARLADACALALDNARLFDVERTTAQQLQSALLPERLPFDPRFDLSADYQAAHETAQIGGDWYDAFWITPDRLALVVGDVVGGGIAAARTMSELRSATSAFAREGHGVGSTLERLHRFVRVSGRAMASTVVYVELDLEAGFVEFGCAGHLPPILVGPGHAELLWDGRGPVLGMLGDRRHAVGRLRYEVGTALVLYTDGLVERRGRSIDVGLEELRSALERDPSLAGSPARLGEVLQAGGHDDDTCVLAAHLGELRTAIDVRRAAVPHCARPS